METPYRSAPEPGEISAPRDTGIVGDVVGQFADPLAFYRELVQNAIDAGSPTVEVRLDHDDATQIMRVVVRDHGEGMDRDIVENHLLVLFRSTKERDPTKIGKFGIGFKSVLAANPTVVLVDTVRDGHRLTVHLYPDLSYELFDTGPAQRSGTSVALELPMPAAEVGDFVDASRAALIRWCRHATCPITLHARGAEEQIQRRLGLEDAVVEVHSAVADGEISAVVGVLPGGASYAGFFNHGLMLHETSEPLLRGLAFKVLDPRLGHTLSRDNVRRDDAFDRALRFVRALAARELPRAAVRALEDAAADPDRRRYAALLDALIAAGVEPGGDGWAFPLIEPLDGRGYVSTSSVPAPRWGAFRRSALTARLAAARVAMIDLGPINGMPTGWLADRLQTICGRRPADVEAELTVTSEVAASPVDRALLAAVADLLDDAHRRPSAIEFAEVAGALAGSLAIPAEVPSTFDRDDADRDPFRLLRRPPLAINAGHPQAIAARRRAAADPVGAASLLARALLLAFGALDRGRSLALLRHTVERL